MARHKGKGMEISNKYCLDFSLLLLHLLVATPKSFGIASFAVFFSAF
jgi:hypothetical protein